MAEQTYPLVLKGELDEPLSPALWLVKWILLIPHFIVLAFLWVAFVFVTFIAFWAILFTGKYPESLFEFNVGVMRWTWRVAFYSYGALATDDYPPFSLDEKEDYPANLTVEYPEQLTQWMVLVKWLLAVPHYLVTALFFGWESTGHAGVENHQHGGLLWILVLIAAIALLFTGKYLKDIFKLVMGLNRWGFRVLAYVALMTDEYPPFRLEE
ncbi:MAG: DUF4389 domain-containing protein [Fidelibacterota bacterium]|nr:MAG: DUF4389 domain-containing protein [Candidatus Neomarinimicrobiota bacterium]